MKYDNDKRTVLTLDAGGTGLVFSAMQGYQEIVDPIRIDSVTDDIGLCLDAIERGFKTVRDRLPSPPEAISFAFPGPADYKRGVIGDLINFPAFRGGVALGPYLEDIFKVPVFINNDGALFAYGEALAGFLPEVNAALRANGQDRRFHNLVGVTLGTGFGCGVVLDGTLLLGDNGCGGDVWCMRNREYPDMIAEESASKRAAIRFYEEGSGLSAEGLTPYDIFLVAEGKAPGDRKAAAMAFRRIGLAVGETLVSVLNIIDGLAVIGGGLSGASKYILPGVIDSLRGDAGTFAGDRFPVLSSKVYNWEDEDDRREFLGQGLVEVKVPRSGKTVPYLERRTLCVGVSKNGASASIAHGAYAYALQQLDSQDKGEPASF